ncbi:MAG: SPFH domain-containing protein [Dermatophilaceae bacterium]
MSPFAVTVPARTTVVEYRHGAVTRVLEAGRHPRRWGTRRVAVDRRESLLSVAPQEVPTADGISVRVSAAVRWSVADPVAFLERHEDPRAAVYLATQVALRGMLATATVADLRQRGAGVSTEALTDAVTPAALDVGVAVAEVVVKDVILPGELRLAALELATSQVRGQARLEAARAETAALRSLANGARLLEANPALARQRLVESLPPGSRVALNVGDAAAPQIPPTSADEE